MHPQAVKKHHRIQKKLFTNMQTKKQTGQRPVIVVAIYNI